MIVTKIPMAAAMVLNIAAAVIFSGGIAFGEPPGRQILAAELLIVRDDLRRLETVDDLPSSHRRGLSDRIAGSFGLLPWLLRQAGDDVTGPVTAKQLDQLIARHPLDLSAYSGAVGAKDKSQAAAIHKAYCAACHDGAGQGDPDTPLPARDLYLMAREAAPEVLLARLINGVKGDETLLFTNPLTTDQLRALWRLYQ